MDGQAMHTQSGASGATNASMSGDSSAYGMLAIPRIAVQAFCETPDFAAVVERTAHDRRVGRVSFSITMGGIGAAISTYANAPTPNLLIVETTGNAVELTGDLARLAEVCDPGTKVVIVGHYNDVALYRDLITRGVSDYIVMPFDIFVLIDSISRIFISPDSEPVGRTLAFVGTKGGVGTSTIAHNLARQISLRSEREVIIADLDLPFGTAAINFNKESLSGMLEAVHSGANVDETMIDRLMTRCGKRLSLLAAPVNLEQNYDNGENDFDGVLDVLRRSVPFIILDMPHMWAAWNRRVLSQVDEVFVITEPDLGNLRNARVLNDALKRFRPNDGPPKILLNKMNVPRRPEIGIEEFRKVFGSGLQGSFSFEPALFGMASNNGQMLDECDRRADIVRKLDEMAGTIAGYKSTSAANRPLGASLLERFRRRKAQAA